jgi:threonine dehydrogenase-like Zn-dependent dehydrogenase
MRCERYLWPRIFGQGIAGIGGCQAEGVEVPQADANLRILAPALSDEIGILLTDTLATAWTCAKKANIPKGGTAAVIGLGAVGFQCVLAAFAMGAGRVFALDLLEDRRLAAAGYGAIPVGGVDVAKEIETATSGLGVDSVLDATGGPRTAELAVQLARKGGTIAIVGVPEPGLSPMPMHLALAKNLDISFIACSVQAALPELFEALASRRLDSKALLGLFTHRMRLSEGAEAYAMFDARLGGVKKIVMTR